MLARDLLLLYIITHKWTTVDNDFDLVEKFKPTTALLQISHIVLHCLFVHAS